jgi:hypothetical protein
MARIIHTTETPVDAWRTALGIEVILPEDDPFNPRENSNISTIWSPERPRYNALQEANVIPAGSLVFALDCYESRGGSEYDIGDVITILELIEIMRDNGWDIDDEEVAYPFGRGDIDPGAPRSFEPRFAYEYLPDRMGFAWVTPEALTEWRPSEAYPTVEAWAQEVTRGELAEYVAWCQGDCYDYRIYVDSDPSEDVESLILPSRESIIDGYAVFGIDAESELEREITQRATEYERALEHTPVC